MRVIFSGRKEERPRKSATIRENKNRSKERRPSVDDASPVAEDFKPEDVSLWEVRASE